jgi:PTS system nitrogen regulatory IIA component
MRLSDILTVERVVVDADGSHIVDQDAALRTLASLIAPAVDTDEGDIYRVLADRERLQSTGIGEGVAIPHASAEQAVTQAAALLLCPRGVEFGANDGHPAKIIFGVVGPRRATGEHLKTLARISRLLRDASTRERLAVAPSADVAFDIVCSQDSSP